MGILHGVIFDLRGQVPPAHRKARNALAVTSRLEQPSVVGFSVVPPLAASADGGAMHHVGE